MKLKNIKLNINPFVLLFSIIILISISSYIINPGAFERQIINGKTIIMTGSFHSIEPRPISLIQMMKSIPEGLIASSSIVFLVLLVGGSIEVYNTTNCINIGVNKLISKVGNKGGTFVLFLIMSILAVMGGFLGWIEAAIPFVPIIIPIILALGYDAMTGVALCILGLMVGFAIGPTNMYTIGIAHQISELPMFSGFSFRFIAYIVFCLTAFIYLLCYANKVKKDPSKSLVKDIDVSSIKINVDLKNLKMTINQTIAILILISTFIIVVYGMIKLSWGINDMTASFVLSGILAGLVNKISPSKIVESFIIGAKGSISGAMIVGVARGVQWILEQGGIIDPVINSLSVLLSGLSPMVSVIGVFSIVTLLNGLVPSGSGKAIALMPILIPLGDMIGLTRQTTILAYQFGDGISNMAWFTYGTLLIFLNYGKVPLSRWYKFLFPLICIFLVLVIIFLFVAVKIGYGG